MSTLSRDTPTRAAGLCDSHYRREREGVKCLWQVGRADGLLRVEPSPGPGQARPGRVRIAARLI